MFMNDVGFSAVLDDSVIDRNQDEVRYEFETSTQVKEWRGILSEGGLGFQVKSFCDFLKRREEGEIDGISELLFAAQNFKYATNITGDYTFDSRNNYTFSIKVNEDRRNPLVSYIGQVWGAINYYKTILQENSILMGDFNSNRIWDGKERIEIGRAHV